MNITEKDYRQFSDMVYLLDPKHKNYDPSLKEGSIKEYDGKYYQILKIQKNPNNGMQAMAIAPVDSNGYPDTTQLTVAYAGTNFDDMQDLLTDAQLVGASKKYIDGQAASAQQFANWIKQTYPNAVVTTTGHSLGEYLALMIAAENQWRNVGFNGPDPYGVLSSEAKEWIKKNPGMLTNYRNFSDMIGNLMGNGTGAEIMIGYFKGNSLNPLEAHALSLWNFDENGRLIIPSSTYDQMSEEELEKNLMSKFVASLYLLKSLEARLVASGGGLSGNEEIYLDASLARSIVVTASDLLKVAMSKVITFYQDAMDEAEKLWTTINTKARNVASDLSEGEIKDALSSTGFTREKIVTSTCEKYQQKIKEAREIGETFESLASEINSKIVEVVQRDQDLARQLQMEG